MIRFRLKNLKNHGTGSELRLYGYKMEISCLGIVENGYEIFNFAVLVDVECSGLIHILQLQQWDVGLGPFLPGFD